MSGTAIAGVVIVLPVVIGIAGGFIGGAIGAFVYNGAAKYIGPVEAGLDINS